MGEGCRDWDGADDVDDGGVWDMGGGRDGDFEALQLEALRDEGEDGSVEVVVGEIQDQRPQTRGERRDESRWEGSH